MNRAKKIRNVLIAVAIVLFSCLIINCSINGTMGVIDNTSSNEFATKAVGLQTQDNKRYSSDVLSLMNADGDSAFNNSKNGYEWNKTFGRGEIDCGWEVKETSDGGYIVVGDTITVSSGSDNSIWLIKTDSYGSEEWNKTFGGGISGKGREVEQTSDGGYIIVGQNLLSYVDGQLADVWLIKTDSIGNEEWNKTFGGNKTDGGISVQQTSDGGYIITGFTGSNVWLIKTDSIGNEEWNSTFGEGKGTHVLQTSDGGYLLTGYIEYFYGKELYDIWLIKTDPYGKEEWNRKYRRIGRERGWEVEQTSDGGYIIVGTIEYFTKTRGKQYPFDVWLIKTDSYGNEEWNKKFGRIIHSEGSYSVNQTLDGGFILAGYIDDGENLNIWLIKTDSEGNIQWERRYGGIWSARAYSIQQTSDGGFIIVGLTTSRLYGQGGADIWLIKVSPLHISSPKSGHLYIADSEIKNTYSQLTTVIIGDITIKADSYGNISIFNKVEFYVDGEMAHADDTVPYKWTWNKFSFGKHTVTAVAYDAEGNYIGKDSITVWKFL